jgi:hypothetical protein
MSGHRNNTRQAEIPFQYEAVPPRAALSPAQQRIEKIDNGNRWAIARLLHEIAYGQIHDLSTTQCELASLLQQDIGQLDEMALAERLEELNIQVRLHPLLPKWASIALLQYHKLWRTRHPKPKLPKKPR